MDKKPTPKHYPKPSDKKPSAAEKPAPKPFNRAEELRKLREYWEGE